MTLQEWIDGDFQETDSDYRIADISIIKKNEEGFLKKGIEVLCDEIKPSSVLEFGFGKGWTATAFQNYGVNVHVILEPNTEVYQMALDWKSNYTSDIEILNMFSWDYETDDTFDIVYDDREPFTSECDSKHFTQMKKILPENQCYGMNAGLIGETYCSGNSEGDYSLPFTYNGLNYKQGLTKGILWQQ